MGVILQAYNDNWMWSKRKLRQQNFYMPLPDGLHVWRVRGVVKGQKQD